MQELLTPDDRAYLIERGYRAEDLESEEIWTFFDGILQGVTVPVQQPVIAFVSRNGLGEVVGIHTASRVVKDYRYFQHPQKQHAPIMYGAADDFKEMLATGKLVLVEGVFDRIAMRRILPGYAVFARLSKGVPHNLLWLIKRYVKQLILAFDQDEAGQDGAAKAERSLHRQVNVTRVQFPVKDPSDLLKKYGEVKARRLVLKQLEGAL